MGITQLPLFRRLKRSSVLLVYAGIITYSVPINHINGCYCATGWDSCCYYWKPSWQPKPGAIQAEAGLAAACAGLKSVPCKVSPEDLGRVEAAVPVLHHPGVAHVDTEPCQQPLTTGSSEFKALQNRADLRSPAHILLSSFRSLWLQAAVTPWSRGCSTSQPVLDETPVWHRPLGTATPTFLLGTPQTQRSLRALRAPSKAAGDRSTKAQAAFSQSASSYQKRHLAEHRDWKWQRGVPGGSRRPWTPCLWSCSAHSTLKSALSEPLTHTLIYSCGFSWNRNSETRCTESLVHGVKASIHHASSPSPMNSFCLLLSSVYIHKQYPYDFFHAYLFPQSLTWFPEAIRKLHINIYINRSLFWNGPQLLLNAIWHQPKIKACLAHRTHYWLWKWV